MQILHDPRAIDPSLYGSVVTIGNFDGVHRGHAALLRRCTELARGAAVIAMTFEPHPVVLLAPERAPRRLTPPEEKMHQLAALGVTATIVLPTDRSLLAIPAEEFVERLLARPLRPAHVVEGPTFGFGAGRRGTVQTLRDLGAQFAYELHVIEPQSLTLPGRNEPLIVSSTLVRRLLDDGNVADAAACLGRPHALIGPVIHGAARGRTMDFPTINLDCGNQQIPADGVYAGRAAFDGDNAPPRAAAVSIGRRPTFGGDARVVEAFLLDTTGDFYARPVRLELLARLRDQRTFSAPGELAAQIAEDVENVRRITQSTTRNS